MSTDEHEVVRRPRRSGGKQQETKYAERKFNPPPPPGERDFQEAVAAGLVNAQAGEGPVFNSDVERGEVGEPMATLPGQRTSGPIVVESDQLAGGGGGRRAAASAAPARLPDQRRQAQWAEAGAGQQNVVLGDVSHTERNEDAVGPQDVIQRPQVGPALPTGEPCVCVERGGMPTSLRGAPSWMTWCVICGGERDGKRRPENAQRYGEPAPPKEYESIDPNAIVTQVTERVVEQVGSMLASDRFLDALTAKLDARETAKTG